MKEHLQICLQWREVTTGLAVSQYPLGRSKTLFPVDASGVTHAYARPEACALPSSFLSFIGLLY